MTCFLKHFVFYTSCVGNEKILIADGTSLIGGKVKIVLFDGFSLQNVLHVPKLSYNLLSISKITMSSTVKLPSYLICLFSNLELGEGD